MCIILLCIGFFFLNYTKLCVQQNTNEIISHSMGVYRFKCEYVCIINNYFVVFKSLLLLRFTPVRCQHCSSQMRHLCNFSDSTSVFTITTCLMRRHQYKKHLKPVDQFWTCLKQLFCSSTETKQKGL